ncbi:ORF68 [Ranid herpesvirus 1]|uniref:ORF68 n=1 Tax=Ranid herpesvirus 1 TaxID=85655 RepID=Q9YR00_9VIRU|nr:ORF68 [Ranid herpesvirus 1]AAD12265.1 ORF68 [Ranid herpesvirus 1]
MANAKSLTLSLSADARVLVRSLVTHAHSVYGLRVALSRVAYLSTEYVSANKNAGQILASHVMHTRRCVLQWKHDRRLYKDAVAAPRAERGFPDVTPFLNPAPDDLTPCTSYSHKSFQIGHGVRNFTNASANRNVFCKLQGASTSVLREAMVCLSVGNCGYIVETFFADLVRHPHGADPMIILGSQGATPLCENFKPAPYCVAIMHDICQALAYLGRRLNMVHLDVKPYNILRPQGMPLNEPRFMLCDFGSAATIGHVTAICGTYSYMAPEHMALMLRGGSTPQYLVQANSDAWALGVTILEIVLGYPFYSFLTRKPNRGQIMNMLADQRTARHESCMDAMPTPIKVVLQKSLSLDPSNRPTPEQALHMMGTKYSPWMRNRSPNAELKRCHKFTHFTPDGAHAKPIHSPQTLSVQVTWTSDSAETQRIANALPPMPDIRQAMATFSPIIANPDMTPLLVVDRLGQIPYVAERSYLSLNLENTVPADFLSMVDHIDMNVVRQNPVFHVGTLMGTLTFPTILSRTHGIETYYSAELHAFASSTEISPHISMARIATFMRQALVNGPGCPTTCAPCFAFCVTRDKTSTRVTVLMAGEAVRFADTRDASHVALCIRDMKPWNVPLYNTDGTGFVISKGHVYLAHGYNVLYALGHFEVVRSSLSAQDRISAERTHMLHDDQLPNPPPDILRTKLKMIRNLQLGANTCHKPTLVCVLTPE